MKKYRIFRVRVGKIIFGSCTVYASKNNFCRKNGRTGCTEKQTQLQWIEKKKTKNSDTENCFASVLVFTIF